MRLTTGSRFVNGADQGLQSRSASRDRAGVDLDQFLPVAPPGDGSDAAAGDPQAGGQQCDQSFVRGAADRWGAYAYPDPAVVGADDLRLAGAGLD